MQTHDLVRLARGRVPVSPSAPPAWVEQSLQRAPWVVVRRVRPWKGLIPVGVRGACRSQRWGGWIDLADVRLLARPEQLLPLQNGTAMDLKAHGALRAAVSFGVLLALRGWSGGPTGSVGFELASGRPTTSASSDLDGVIRCANRVFVHEASHFLDSLRGLAARCDILMETPRGAVALAEFAAGGQVVARSQDGPELIEDPWAVSDPPAVAR